MEPTTFVLFGATGDLAKRKIYPALYRLFADRKLPQSFSVFGLGRTKWTDESFRANVEESLRRFSGIEAKDSAAMNEFLQAFRYHVLDVGKKEDYAELLGRIERREEELRVSPNRLFYLSVGPEYFETIASNLHESGLSSVKGWKRLVIEKPFGRDLPSARSLNEHLGRVFDESEIYRIDHYLGKPMVQQMGQRLRAALSEHDLTARRIANVQITASETLGVEERAGYYDQSGAMRDMFQNHMLQLLMMLMAGLPNTGPSEEVAKRKKAAMKSLRPIGKAELGRNVVRGQYGAGESKGEQAAAYTKEPGIAPGSRNDTYIAARLVSGDSSLMDVPVYIRTGKRLKEKSTRIVVEFASEGPLRDLLVVEIGPREGISVMTVLAGDDPKPVQGRFAALEDGSPEAYEMLIRDAIGGDKTYFAHWDEVELSWELVQPMLDAFEENLLPIAIYPAGTEGPAEADRLTEQDGFRWWPVLDIDSIKEADAGERYVYEIRN